MKQIGTQKTHEEWYVGVRTVGEELDGETGYHNAIFYWPKQKGLSHKYVKTEKEAREILDNAYSKFNKEFKYNADGKRYEHQQAGSFGIAIECDAKSDDRMRIASHIIKKRIVTEWEVAEQS